MIDTSHNSSMIALIPASAVPYINLFLLVLILIIILFWLLRKSYLRIGPSANYLHTQAEVKSMKFAPNSFIAITKDHQIIMWNPASETLFGYKAHDMRGKNIDIIMTEDNKKLFDAAMVIDNGVPIELEVRHKNGISVVPIETTVWKWRDENGVGEYWTAISKDISHRRGNEKVKEKLHKSLNELKLLYLEAERTDCSGICLWDMVNNKVIVASEGFKDILDVDERVLSINSLLARIHGQDKPFVIKKLREIEEHRKNCNFEFRIIAKDARINTIQCKLKCYLDDNLQVKTIMWIIRVIKTEEYASKSISDNSE